MSITCRLANVLFIPPKKKIFSVFITVYRLEQKKILKFRQKLDIFVSTG